MSGDQRAIGCLREIILSGEHIKVGEITLRVGVGRGEFQRSLEFRHSVVFLSLRSKDAPQLEMNVGVIGALGGQSAQQGFCFAQAAGLHVQVGEADRGFRGLGSVECGSSVITCLYSASASENSLCRSCSRPAERWGSGSFGVSSEALR